MRNGSWKWFVYIIECLDKSYYVGRTWKVELRYDQHTSGLGGAYTAKHGVKRLAYIEEHTDFETASLREKQLKGWTREKRKTYKWSLEKRLVTKDDALRLRSGKK